MSKQQGEPGAVALGAWFLGRAMLGAIVAIGLLALIPALLHPADAAVPGGERGPVFGWLLLDAQTGQVLSEQNADVQTYPASLTKMMTLYLTFEALNQGRVSLDQRFPVSTHAASRSPSKLGLSPGDAVPLRDLILGVVTRSANDASAVVAEGLAGSEANFARYMTWKARQLGMQHTWYQNASGLPHPEQRTTARDVARLSLALYHQFPREYRYFATREFDFRGDPVRTHNRLLEWYHGADGIKTGFVNASGFNLAASAVRDGRRLIGVIVGGRSARSRDAQMGSLLDQGFALLASGQTAPALPQMLPPAALPQTVIAAAAPPPIAAVSQSTQAPPPMARAVATAPPPAAARSEARGEEAPAAVAAAGTQQKLRNVANAALRRLSPVAKAEAAPLAHAIVGDREEWAIQIGAFGGEAAAEQAARKVSSLAIVKGKAQQILAPAKSDKPRLYRARLLHFTQKGAQAACAELKRRGTACTIMRVGVRAGALKVASR